MFKVVSISGICILVGDIYNTLMPLQTLCLLVEQRGVGSTLYAVRVPQLAITSVIIGLGQLMLNRGTSNQGTKVRAI